MNRARGKEWENLCTHGKKGFWSKKEGD